jgi:hypothetical protein
MKKTAAFLCIMLIAAPSFAEYAGPGGAGVALSIVSGPTDGDYLVGTDVAGIFMGNRDDGFVSVTANLPSHYVPALDVQATSTGHRIWAGTAAGLYKSDDYGNNWEELTALLPDASFPTESAKWDGLRVPVRAVRVDPNDANRIFIGLGLGNHIQPFAVESDHKIYRSTDGGVGWTGILDLDNDESSYGAVVYQITIPDVSCDESGCNTIWVSTDKGLYLSRDSGERWYAMGRSPIRVSDNYGNSWQPCTDASVGCPVEFTTDCDATDSCLPLATNSGESLPDTRSTTQITDSNGNIVTFVSLYDNGYLNAGEEGCPAAPDADDYVADTTGSHTVSGVYRSDNGGVVWQKIDAQAKTESQLPKTIRCGESSGTSFTTKNTIYVDFAVDENDPEHLVAIAIGPKRGIYELTVGAWRQLDSNEGRPDWNVSGTCIDLSCLDGASRAGLYGTTLPYLTGAPPQNSFNTNGSLVFPISRGAMRISNWDDVPNIDHMHQIYDETKDTWRGTGLDDACIYGGVAEIRQPFTLSDSATTLPEGSHPYRRMIGRRLVMGVADLGILYSRDNGNTWTQPSDHSDLPLQTGKDGRHVALPRVATGVTEADFVRAS